MVSHMRAHRAICLTLIVASAALGGGPEWSDTSLAQLIAQTNLVLVVESATPFEARTPNDEGCEELRWRVTVREVVRSSLDRAPKPGQVIEAVANLSTLFDCHLKHVNPTGGSFNAPRYHSPAAEPPKKGPFLLFVRQAPVGFVLTVDGAWDHAARATEVRKVAR